ncbi:MAG: M3 family oligoendopeptidase [Bacteroidota bacterium]
MNTITIPRPRQRAFLPEEFKLTVWSKIKPYYNELLKRPIESKEDLECWLSDKSELEAMVTESLAWRYIRITANSKDKKAEELYQYAIEELSPRITAFENKLNNKLVACPFIDELPQDRYFVHIRGIKNRVALFEESNIPLSTEVQIKAKEYGKILSEMTIGMDGKQMTLQKASTLLEEPDRTYREQVYYKINQRILQDTEHIEELFDALIEKRHRIALNAGFPNFRDYKFKALGRFDYTPADCADFHQSIAEAILPIIDELYQHRQQALRIEQLRPWDLNVDTSGKAPLVPFSSTEELVNKAIDCLNSVHPLFGEVIQIMDEMDHLDLDIRHGKRPGGYNMPLHITGVPFIFMNASHSLGDMRTLLHESGHAVHSYLTRDYKLASAKLVPIEVAELAAMSMELLTMEHWDIFFPDPADLRRAKINQLENVLKILPWIATIDKFQHWLYTNPSHTREERKEKWVSIFMEFNSSAVDMEGLQPFTEYVWHKQLHLFEVPFYYIEYGMAQLGAIAIWKQYKENPDEALQNYINALKLGYTTPIKEIFNTAGVPFDFSKAYVNELSQFVKEELHQLIN